MSSKINLKSLTLAELWDLVEELRSMLDLDAPEDDVEELDDVESYEDFVDKMRMIRRELREVEEGTVDDNGRVTENSERIAAFARLAYGRFLGHGNDDDMVGWAKFSNFLLVLFCAVNNECEDRKEENPAEVTGKVVNDFYWALHGMNDFQGYGKRGGE